MEHWNYTTRSAGEGILALASVFVAWFLWFHLMSMYTVELREWIVTGHSNWQMDVSSSKPMCGVFVMDVNKTVADSIRTVWWESEAEFQHRYKVGDRLAGWFYPNVRGSYHNQRCFVPEWDPVPREPGVPPLWWVTKTWLVMLIMCCCYFCAGFLYGLVHVCCPNLLTKFIDRPRVEHPDRDQ